MALSDDGVPIAYSTWGAGQPALVFIHGGFADQEFWREQVEPLAGRFQVVTLDLAGHGESGSEREDWSLARFGDDVWAVVEALDLESVVLVGNSLGGPVALATARRLPGVARGVVAVDTFQDAGHRWPRAELEAYVEALRADFPATCRQMMGQLLVEHTAPDLAAWVEERMCGFDPELAHRVVSGFLDYDGAAAFAEAAVPVRAILGETMALDLDGNRALRPEFAAVVMEGTGHYPMLERPEEFNRHLKAFVDEMSASEEAMSGDERDRRVDYIEFRSTDLEATRTFYTRVFGWEFTDYGPEYTSFADGRLSGGFALAPEVASGGPLVVVYARELEEVEGRVVEHGGEVTKEIFEFPGGRRFHFTDPSGNELAVWSDR